MVTGTPDDHLPLTCKALNPHILTPEEILNAKVVVLDSHFSPNCVQHESFLTSCGGKSNYCAIYLRELKFFVVCHFFSHQTEHETNDMQLTFQRYRVVKSAKSAKANTCVTCWEEEQNKFHERNQGQNCVN